VSGSAEELERQRQERVLNVKEISEERPFLTNKPHTYEVANDGTIPRFAKTLLAQKVGGIRMTEALHHNKSPIRLRLDASKRGRRERLGRGGYTPRALI
jgi:hypothetical protein